MSTQVPPRCLAQPNFGTECTIISAFPGRRQYKRANNARTQPPLSPGESHPHEEEQLLPVTRHLRDNHTLRFASRQSSGKLETTSAHSLKNGRLPRNRRLSTDDALITWGWSAGSE
ncbi:unnamed protein product [Ectocarpus fasciculatus]